MELNLIQNVSFSFSLILKQNTYPKHPQLITSFTKPTNLQSLNVQISCKTPMNVYTPKLQITDSSLLSDNVCVKYENKLKQN